MTEHRTVRSGSTGHAIDEALLVEQARGGDMAAFSRLVTRYQDRILNTCWRMCGNLEDAQDLTQEAFLKALESLGGFRRQANFYTWLYRIAINLSITHMRKRKRAVVLSLHQQDGTMNQEASGESTMRDIPSTLPDPPTHVSSREIEQRAVEALDSLDDDHRAVVVLRDLEAMNYEEIAAVLEVPTGTVKSRLHRARLALRDQLRPIVSAERLSRATGAKRNTPS